MDVTCYEKIKNHDANIHNIHTTAGGLHELGGEPNMVSGQGEMEKTEFGALRESNKGRGRFDLMPYEALEALAKWYEAGAEKYDERNWESGISVKDCINRMCRHAGKVASGWTDEDHLAAVMWNAAAAITMMQRKPECNDHTWHPQKPYTPEFMVKEFHIPREVDTRNMDTQIY